MSDDPDDCIHYAFAKFGLANSVVTTVADANSSIVRLVTTSAGEELVLKIPWNREKFEREVRVIRALAQHPHAPRLVDQFSDDTTFAILMTRLPGEPISLDAMTPALAADIGECLALLHIDLHERSEWRAMFMALVTANLAKCREHGDHEDWDRAEQLFARSTDAIPATTDLRLVHFDYRLGNLLHVDGRLSGVVDFESSRSASPEYDFTRLFIDVADPAFHEHMRAGYARVRPLPRTLDAAMPIYKLYFHVVSVAWCIKHGKAAGYPFYDVNRALVTAALKG